MKSNAPEELKDAFYQHTIDLESLVNHPGWIEWLNGQEEYLKEHFPIGWQMNEWLVMHKEDIPEVVENYLIMLFENDIRDALVKLDNFEIEEHLSKGLFKERNPDCFFDDLPYSNIVATIEDRALTMDDVFNLSEEEKELLKDKNLAVGFDTALYQDLFRVFGSRVKDFELYKKYRGILRVVTDNCRSLESVKSDEDKEDLLKNIFVNGLSQCSGSCWYNDDVPDEFKQEYPEFFLDEDAPKELKDIFYYTSILISGRLQFDDLRKYPEYISYLKGKDIRHCIGYRGEYDKFFDFCEDKDLALDLGLKYGNYVGKMNFEGVEEEDKEAVIAKQIYSAIIYQCYNYNEDMPEYFKNKYPQLFLDEDAPEELKEIYYTKKTSRDMNGRYIGYFSSDWSRSDWDGKEFSFNFIKENPKYIEFLVGKELRGTLNGKYKEILDMCDGSTERFLSIGLEYGYTLVHPQLSNRISKLAWQLLNTNPDDEELRDALDKEIGEAIRERDLLMYDDELPLRLQYKYPDLFLLPEELDRIKASIYSWENDEELNEIKQKFYKRCISFRDLYINDELKEIIRHKDINRCMDFYKAGEFFEKFSELLGGNYDKAYNLSVNKYSQQLTSILYGHIASENIDKVLEFYKQAKFIPHSVVVTKLPNEKIKGFALNRNLWAELMKMEEYSSNDGYIGSLLELATVMGVFETKEFKKNGKIMVQGAGEEGFEKLQELINHIPDFIEVFKSQDEIDSDEFIFVKDGYFKFDNDYQDALRDRHIQIVFSREGLLDELKEGLLTDYDMKNVIKSYIAEEDIEEFFRKDSNGRYQYILDKNSNAKVQKLLKTVGIKQDRWLTQEEFELIKSCNSEFISKAFIQEGEGYRFNISKQGEFYVVGNETEITELQSRTNKKLFDYVRFLMQEFSMEEEALALAANNDRSNINLVLDNEKMDKLRSGAEWVVNRTLDKYEECSLCKLTPQSYSIYSFFSAAKIHQIFDGLNLEYSKAFRDFILENRYEIINDNELSSLMKEFQSKIKELSQDPDYANIKLTPEVLIKALVSNENQYSNKKIGFEKGEELASKLAFSQEYFDHAQRIWSEARKREVSTIPRIKGEENSFSYEVLRLDDAEGIYIGNLTDCCQKLAGAGESSMLHSMKERNGRVFVIRDANRRIVSQSWLWRNGNTICFDNVEIPDRAKSNENEEAVYNILKNVAKKLCDKDAMELSKLVEVGKISKEKANELMLAKVTVGKGHNDIEKIACNYDKELEDTEIKRPVEEYKVYKGICSRDNLYISDSNHQVILYQAEDYISSDSMMAIHRDENIELSYSEMRHRELRMIRAIMKEVEGNNGIETREDILKKYNVSEDEVRLVQGTDWFMLYSERDEDITVHKILKSPSSGIRKKSMIEQKKAVQMLMDKGKRISMEFENDKIHDAARTMVRHMGKRYTMKVADAEGRMSVSEIHLDNR